MSKNTSFYFPILFIIPNFNEQTISCGSIGLNKRLWETTIFDLATLATKHKLHMAYQAIDIFLQKCNLEFCISNQKSFEDAVDTFQSLRFALYLEDLPPFLCPFISNYSINDYSGINSRDSSSLRDKLHPGLREGITSENSTVEIWPFELSFNFITNLEVLQLSSEQFRKASEAASKWRKITANTKSLRVLEEVATTGPKVGSLSQSLLHLWSGLEALFPNIGSELSFKISSYLAQLNSCQTNKFSYHNRVRNSYGLRSSVTHGSKKDISFSEWYDTWSILMDSGKSIIGRGKLPTERELLEELLASG